MGKNILRKHFENMYGNNKPLQSNKGTNNLLKNISVNNAEGENMNMNVNNTTNRIKNLIDTSEKNTDKYFPVLPKVNTPSTFGFGGILLLTAFLIVVMTIIYFRDSILKFFTDLKTNFIKSISQTSSPYKSLEEKYNDMMKQMLEKTAETEQTLQSKNKELYNVINSKEQEIEELNKSLNDKELENQTKQSEISQGAIGQVNCKLSEMCNFKRNTRVIKDGYCYIGYDLGKRECTDVYAGDICMSGKIFPTMAQCQNPTLR